MELGARTEVLSLKDSDNREVGLLVGLTPFVQEDILTVLSSRLSQLLERDDFITRYEAEVIKSISRDMDFRSFPCMNPVAYKCDADLATLVRIPVAIYSKVWTDKVKLYSRKSVNCYKNNKNSNRLIVLI
jgi:hypothetical protein